MTLTGRILITGGSGTLGRAIVRTAEQEGWDAEFTIYSRSEYLQAQMRSQFPHARYLLGDVRDYDRLAAAVVGHDVVIHAAAMKRLPECEAQPTECMQTNVVGSANVARACIAGGVARCVGISTDKAARPSRPMGPRSA
jgi:UDP-N-acetylglucosamine 4,6-dehydratase